MPLIKDGLTNCMSNKRLVKISAAVTIALVLLMLYLSSILSGKKQVLAQTTPAPVLTVTVQPAVIKSVDRLLSVHGSVSAWDPISIGATAGGLEVSSVLVEEGALVKKGQCLVILDSAQLQAQLESERARLAAGIAAVSKSIQPNRPEDINGLAAAVLQAQATVEDQQAALVQAQANLANARGNLKRYQYLKSEGAVSAQEAEDRETTAQVYEATVGSAEKKVKATQFALRQAQEHFSMAKQGGRKEDIQIARANAAEIQGNIKRLQTQIDETFIKAPVDGLVTRRDVHIGDISAAGKTMFLMARDNRLEIKAQVPESDLRLVQPGQIVSINSSFLGQDKVKGHVREISPLVDSDTRLATVRIDMPDNCGLKPGMYAEGHIDLGQYLALTVPSQAVISRDEKNTVFVLHHNRVESRPVLINNRDNNFVQISSGLKDKEQIIIDGAGFLKDGDCVAVAD